MCSSDLRDEKGQGLLTLVGHALNVEEKFKQAVTVDDAKRGHRQKGKANPKRIKNIHFVFGLECIEQRKNRQRKQDPQQQSLDVEAESTELSIGAVVGEIDGEGFGWKDGLKLGLGQYAHFLVLFENEGWKLAAEL